MATTADGDLLTLRGRVEVLHYASPEFSAGRLRTTEGEIHSFAGKVMVRLHDPVVLYGSWERHRIYGLQFQVKRHALDQDLDRDALAHLLAHHPDFPGIGPVKAGRIAEAFAGEFERVLLEEPERIAEVAGVPLGTVESMGRAWERTRTVNAAMVWLAGFELTHHQVTSLVEKYGSSIVAVLDKDPYLIVREIPGFGFQRVDQVAQKMGTPKDHPGRIGAGIHYCVEAALDQGDCWVDFEELVARANVLLAIDRDDSRTLIEGTLDTLIESEKLACVPLGGRFLVALPAIHAMETDLAGWLTRSLAPNPHLSRDLDLGWVLEEFATELNAGQRRAVTAAVQHNQVLISGAAGSGKTRTLASITRLYESRGLRVVLAAPTGKAAKRMEEVIGTPAFTLHRLLGFNGVSFKRGPESPVEADVVLVDEVSMMDVPLAWRLYRALDLAKTAVVLVGDHNQLPPVGPGNLLRDLIERRPIPTVVLDEVVRQAGVLKENSTAILRGEVRRSVEPGAGGRRPWIVADEFRDVWDVRDFLLGLFERVLAERLGYDLLEDVQLLTPQHKGPIGVRALNAELQRLLQKKLWGVEVPVLPAGRRPPFLLHDRVIQTRNDYRLGVMNGAIGTVTEVDPRSRDLRVRFEDREVEMKGEAGQHRHLQLAYALTIHKSQGSEFPCAVVVVHKSHSFMHHRNLLYTGVTRAAETAILVGDRWGIRNCAEKQQVERRKTFLSVLDLPGSRSLGAEALAEARA